MAAAEWWTPWNRRQIFGLYILQLRPTHGQCCVVGVAAGVADNFESRVSWENTEIACVIDFTTQCELKYVI